MLILALGVISCSQEDILDPDLMLTDLRDDDPSCELGFVDRELRNDDYYIQGEFNGEDWDLDNPVFTLPVQCATYFNIGGEEYDQCGQIDYFTTILRLESIPEQGILIEAPRFDLSFNYGDIHEPITTSSYDSIITDSEINSFVQIDLISDDFAVIEGQFAIHATRKSSGVLQDPSEPEEIVIRNGRFRLKNQCQ